MKKIILFFVILFSISAGYSQTKKDKIFKVAIISYGVDTTDQAVKDLLWTNPNEIPNNGIDDDGNGFVDDTCNTFPL